MNILLFSSIYPSELRPDLGIYTQYQFEEIAKHHNVLIVVPVPWPIYLKGGVASRTATNGLQTIYFPYFYTPKVGRGSYGASMYWSAKTIARQIKAFAPDVVLGSFAYPDGYAAWKLGRDLGCPVGIQLLGSDINVNRLSPQNRPRLQQMFADVDFVMSVSQDLANKAIELNANPETTHVVYNGLNREVFKPLVQADAKRSLGLDSETKYFVCVGNVLASKGVFDLYAGFVDFAKSQSQAVHLTFLGDGPDRPRLAEKILSDNAGRIVSSAGRISHAELPVWLNAADFFCTASHNEGVPNVILESLACGLPVVSTDVGGISEIIDSSTYGILVEPHNPKAFAAALDSAVDRQWDATAILDSPKLRNWAENAAEMAQIMERVANAAN